MIRKVKYQEIDFSKFQKCIDSSHQKNLYCQKDTLDFLCKNWELLVYNDYEAVMPVPFVKKAFIKVVLMPLFCQQLGVFGTNDLVINDAFLGFLEKEYNVLGYAFNQHNQFSKDLEFKKNFYLQTQEYAFLRRKKYFKGRKSTVKTAQYLEFKEVFADVNIIEFIKNNFKGLEKESDMDFFIQYVRFLENKKQLKIFGSYFENQLTNVAVLIDNEDSLSLLGLLNDENFKNHNGASFLIDKILQDNIEQKGFNFMGGSIRGIEVFFKSFGSNQELYPIITNSKIQLIKKLIKIS